MGSPHDMKDLESGENVPLYGSEDSGNLLKNCEDEIRRGFVSKVLSIVTFQFVFTTFFTCIPFITDEIYEEVKPKAMVAGAVGGVFIIFATFVRCCSNVERKYPGNYIFLGLFTLGLSCIVQSSAMMWLPQSEFPALVLIFAATIAMTVTLAIIAKVSSIDFTGWLPYLWVSLVGLTISVCPLRSRAWILISCFWDWAFCPWSWWLGTCWPSCRAS